MNRFRFSSLNHCVRHLPILAVVLLLIGISEHLTIPSAHAADNEKSFGIAKRIPWNSSHVVGTPDPPTPFRTERVFDKVKLDNPTDIQPTPDGKWWIVCQEWGVIRAFANEPNAERADVFLDLSKKTKEPKPRDMHHLWSMTFHPKFAENGFLYACYHDDTPQPPTCKILRFHVDPNHLGNPPKCDPATEKVVIEWPAGEDHWGGCLKFGPDGFLYFSVGDGSGYGDHKSSGQDITDFQASIHRIDVDHPDGNKNYSVPKDNPFVNTPGAQPAVWAFGLRNVWKMSFDRTKGDLWGADVGQDLWESVFRITKGANYGWSVFEGTHPFRPERKLAPVPVTKPIVEHEHSESRSITGGFVYRGKQFPELEGYYIYGDYDTGIIWAFKFDGEKATDLHVLDDTPLRIVGFGEAIDGELLILDHTGQIHRLDRMPPIDPANPPPDFPRKLSQTGLFTSTEKNIAAPGLIPYAVNSPLWSDHAHKERFLAIPGDKQLDYRPNNAWQFPEQSVLVKTFSLDLEQGNPTSRKRLETRILHIEENHWRGYTYLWNDEQTDAVLLEDPKGRDHKFSIKDASVAGGVREQTWHFPSRAECTLCHTMPTGFVLGPSTLQMNRDFDYGGVVDNQIRALEHAGLFKEPVLESHNKQAKGPKKLDAFADLPKLPDPTNEKETLDARARSYLHANCAHCHMKWGGGNAYFWLPYAMALDDTKTIDVLPQHGNLNIADARVLVTGSPEKSLLWQRMGRRDERGMPRVASSVVDEDAVKLIEAWIQQLPVTNKK